METFEERLAKVKQHLGVGATDPIPWKDRAKACRWLWPEEPFFYKRVQSLTGSSQLIDVLIGNAPYSWLDDIGDYLYEERWDALLSKCSYKQLEFLVSCLRFAVLEGERTDLPFTTALMSTVAQSRGKYA